MANISRNFIRGRMNKSDDERLIPNGEYIDALNVRLSSTEESENGAVENSKGNTKLTSLSFQNTAGISTPLSSSARCIGALSDSVNENIYWFIHDSAFASSPTGKADMIVSMDTKTNILKYHVISTKKGSTIDTTLNFNPDYLITAIDIIDGLLFFSDNYNPPRFINVNRTYINPSLLYIDGVTEEQLLVIKKPPVDSPVVRGTTSANQNNFLEERFISFATRYRYSDGEYSATSQFSDPVFTNGNFDLDTSTMSNSGMRNLYTGAEITYNSGGPLVTGVDLLFKDMNSNIIKIIERIKKTENGLSDNTEYTFNFSGNQIYTILPESEILRLYDNVPRLAQAQTLMGNRLIYGNYVEGYDIPEDTRLTFDTDIISESIGDSAMSTVLESGNYTWANTVPGIPIADSKIRLALNFNLIKDSVLSLNFNIQHGGWVKNSLSSTTPSIPVSYNFTLPKTYDSVHEMAISSEFRKAIGTTSNIQIPTGGAAADFCAGTTFTDIVGCLLPGELFNSGNSINYKKYQVGKDSANQPILISSAATTNFLDLQLIAMQWVSDVASPGNSYAIEGFRFTDVEARFIEGGASESLHSNRDYSVGIVYMDEFNRSSTALVSPFNSVHTPCFTSTTKNRIQVTIPPSQIPPTWATRYKFVIKPDQENYDIIYSNRAYQDPFDYSVWFLLQGENSRKVEVGDTLIVKNASSGPTTTCVQAEVLDKVAQQADFLNLFAPSGTKIPIPAGTYMQMRANNFSVSTNTSTEDIFNPGEKSYTAKEGFSTFTSDGRTVDVDGVEFPLLTYSIEQEDPDNPGSSDVFAILKGADISLDFSFSRVGRGKENCEKRLYNLSLNLIAEKDYPTGLEGFFKDQVAKLLNSGTQDVGGNDPDINNQYIDTSVPGNTPPDPDEATNYFYFTSINGVKHLNITGTNICTPFINGLDSLINRNDKASTVTAKIQILNTSLSQGTVVFETVASAALPDVWFESSKSYAITNGLHQGTDSRNQTALVPAIIGTEFFNCYAFGNGVESYKITDSLVGKPLTLGNRVTTTSAEEYKKAHRFADLTYSGVYNDETNVNKLNEFNLGLLNFKPLEETFGPVMKLDGRETDILTLQEDKISYVLSGKNLISDSTGGGVISSVPEVLGQQIARIENYGIGNNPESFAKWGPDKFFTDSKRGAVIQLRGSSARDEQLKVISEFKMRSWFRDLFIDSFGNQKIGGYDPYMNEYVISSNNQALPAEIIPEPCGNFQNLDVIVGTPITYTVELGELVGISTVNYNVDLTGGSTGVDISVLYDTTTTASGNVTTNGTFDFDKDKVNVTIATITITAAGEAGAFASVGLSVGCVEAVQLTLVQVTVNNQNVAGKSIHNVYQWSEGTFRSFPNITNVTLNSGGSPVVSQFSSVTAPQGGSYAPSNSAIVDVISYKLGGDNFNYELSEILAGANTSSATDKLIDSGATFVGNINAGDIVFNTTTLASATVVSVDTNIQLTLDANIFTTTLQDYRIIEPGGDNLRYLRSNTSYNNIIDDITGANTSVATNKLIDTGANFIGNVIVGCTIANTSVVSSTAKVVSVDSNTQLTLDTDIFPVPAQNYEIKGVNSLITSSDTLSVTEAFTGYFTGSFNMTGTEGYLYMIYDYRTSNSANLCYSGPYSSGLSITGSNEGAGNQLGDSSKDFICLGVEVGDIVTNTSDSSQATTTVQSIDSSSILTLAAAIFATPVPDPEQNYKITRADSVSAQESCCNCI